jgi:hypothetical protein
MTGSRDPKPRSSGPTSETDRTRERSRQRTRHRFSQANTPGDHAGRLRSLPQGMNARSQTSRARSRVAPSAAALCLLVGVALGFGSQAPPRTHHVYPGGDLSSAVIAARSKDRIVVHGGAYPRATLEKRFTSQTTIVPAPGELVTVAGFDINGASHISIKGLRVDGGTKIYNGADHISFWRVHASAPSGDAAFQFESGAHSSALRRSTVVGAKFGVRFYGGSDPGTWPVNIVIADNNLVGAHGDEIQVNGGRKVTIAGNQIHDLQWNEGHNDGIQAIASDRLRVVRNTFYSMTYRGSGGPDQGIILGHSDPPQATRKVTNTAVVGNLIHHWPGVPIILAGTANTQIVNNTAYDSGNRGEWSAFHLTAKDRRNEFQNTRVEIWNNIFNRMTIDDGSSQAAYCGYNLIWPGRGDLCGSRLLTVNPRFLDHVTYRLPPNSPATNSGVRRPGTPTLDLGGRRYGIPDRGARAQKRLRKERAAVSNGLG